MFGSGRRRSSTTTTTSSTTNSDEIDNHHHPLILTGPNLQTDDVDKFYSHLLSRDYNDDDEENNRHSSSGVAVAVPFTWESEPGTPKHSFYSDPILPPLTPPPSYFSTTARVNVRHKDFSSSFSSAATRRHLPPRDQLVTTDVKHNNNRHFLRSLVSFLKKRNLSSSSSSSATSAESGDHQLSPAVASPASTLCFGRSGRRRRRPVIKLG